ncbi:phosphoribosylanthranilate isomerase [Oribacterium sp. WCC10]|uniref:phosphoribosylanthranilate isomerase n=1 Tax=Oribacterium sp. WCC10 TaxID=1855343 RepID=UPI0008E18B7E|nr:phosphoribosylanthranilate isomerase [Oribacterium sp. WCC10]SFG38083.1 phosphoribosylanthranilate isomerase [Oribacterium sp. WCC10]
MSGIKICGLRRPEDIEAVNELKPEYIGFVFYKKSRRYVTEAEAEQLSNMLLPSISAVGVFVSEDRDIILRLMRKGIISIAQLHGDESAEYIKELQEELKKPGEFPDGTPYSIDGKVMKAFLVRTSSDVKNAEMSPADYILLDKGMGDGETFNWELIKGLQRPYFLAGGLNPDNVSEAVRKLNPYALDVSSGVETGGFKDPVRMKTFVEAVRSLDLTEK